MCEERECSIQKKVQMICPHCSGMIQLPMCTVVNGEEIFCPHCQKKLRVVHPS